MVNVAADRKLTRAFNYFCSLFEQDQGECYAGLDDPIRTSSRNN